MERFMPHASSRLPNTHERTSPPDRGASSDEGSAALLRRTATLLIRQRTDGILQAVSTALGWIGECAAVDRVTLKFFHAGARRPGHTLLSTSDDADAPEAGPPAHSPDAWPSDVIRINDTAIPPHAAGAGSPQVGDARAVVVLPHTLPDNAHATVMMEMLREPRDWTDQDVDMLSVVSEILALAVNRYEIERGSVQTQRKLRLMARLNSVGEVAAVLAHELNQPLAAIVNFSAACHRSAVNGTLGTDELINDLEHIERQSHRAASIIHRLRAFVGGATPRGAVSLNEVIRDVIPLLHPDPEEEGVEVELDLAEGLPNVIVDRVQIEQVVANLCRNGVESMSQTPSEQRQLRVRTRLAPDGFVEVLISDRGEGVDADRAGTLFTSFNSTKPGGMGLGLTIARRILDHHEGRLDWRSRSGGGSTFFFRLPVPTREAP